MKTICPYCNIEMRLKPYVLLSFPPKEELVCPQCNFKKMRTVGRPSPCAISENSISFFSDEQTYEIEFAKREYSKLQRQKDELLSETYKRLGIENDHDKQSVVYRYLSGITSYLD